jgi:predicted RNase H-like HicB family nuclease
MSDRYSIEIFWSDEDKGWIATVPDLPGISAFGVTRGVALAEIQLVIPLAIESMRAVGNPIPEPRHD